jgi:hypothetical protein
MQFDAGRLQTDEGSATGLELEVKSVVVLQQQTWPHAQMIMIPHQTVGQDLHPPPGMTLAQQLEKSLIVRSIGKHRLAGDATIHHVIDGAGIGNAQGTSHGATIVKLSPPCNNRLDPCFDPCFGSSLLR